MDNEQGALPPSGHWIGYYLYAPGGPRNSQSMTLSFSGDALSGTGVDGIGSFTIAGRYDAGSRTAEWVKQYLGMHAVLYRGYYERGAFWGVWRINAARGGFRIWPLTGPEVEIFEAFMRVRTPVGGP